MGSYRATKQQQLRDHPSGHNRTNIFVMLGHVTNT